MGLDRTSERLSHESARVFRALVRQGSGQKDTRIPSTTLRPISGAASLMNEVAE